MHKDFFTHIITHKPELFQAILRFNGRHPSPTPPPVPEYLQVLSPDCAARLWEALVSSTQAARRFPARQPRALFWDFSEESRRLALLEPDLLSHAVQLFGAALHAEEAARIIRKDELTALREHIGAQTLTYALERGRYQLGSTADLFRALHVQMPLHERIALHGRLALELCLASWPRDLRNLCGSRFESLLHTKTPSDEGAPGSPEDDALEGIRNSSRKIWFGFKKILLREVAPQWAPCFD